MDFRLSPAEDAFRRELSAWLDANVPRDFDPDRFEFGLTADERFAWQLDWHRRLHAGGWVGIHWPREYGGRGATLMEQSIFADELGRRRLPAGANLLGMLLVGPTLMHWGTEMVRQVTSEAIQAHGGIGFTWEHDMHLFHRRALSQAVAFGSAAVHREVVARALLA